MVWGTLADGRIYANASQRFAQAPWFHQTPNPYNEERAQRTEMILWGDIKRCNAIGVSVHRVQADGFTLHRCLLTDQNALAKHRTCLGVGEATLFQASKRELLSSCWVLIGVGNSGRRADLCQCVAKIGPRDMVSPNTQPLQRGSCAPNRDNLFP